MDHRDKAWQFLGNCPLPSKVQEGSHSLQEASELGTVGHSFLWLSVVHQMKGYTMSTSCVLCSMPVCDLGHLLLLQRPCKAGGIGTPIVQMRTPRRWQGDGPIQMIRNSVEELESQVPSSRLRQLPTVCPHLVPPH